MVRGLSFTVFHPLVVDVVCVLFWTLSMSMVQNQNTCNIYHKRMKDGVQLNDKLLIINLLSSFQRTPPPTQRPPRRPPTAAARPRDRTASQCTTRPPSSRRSRRTRRTAAGRRRSRRRGRPTPAAARRLRTGPGSTRSRARPRKASTLPGAPTAAPLRPGGARTPTEAPADREAGKEDRRRRYDRPPHLCYFFVVTPCVSQACSPTLCVVSLNGCGTSICTYLCHWNLDQTSSVLSWD